MFWSTLLSLPAVLFAKKQPAEEGPLPPSSTNPPSIRERVVATALGELGSSDAAKYWASASPHVNMLGADWCGAFALWTLHQSGLATDWEWEPGLGFLMTNHHRLPMVKEPQIGDIAYFTKNQHEAVVARVNTDGTVLLVNGNGEGRKVTTSVVPIKNVTAFFSIEPLLDQVTVVT